MASATTPASPLTPTRGSARLARAVAAERRALERKRGQLSRRRERLIAGLEPIDLALAQIDERVALLDRLAGPLPIGHDALDAGSSTVDGAMLLRGPAIREVAVRTLRAQPQVIEALHYRDWYELVRRAGYTVAGSDSLARGELERLERELQETAAAELHATELADGRACRHRLRVSIDRHERALEEALRTLSPHPGDRRPTSDPDAP